MSGKDNPPSTNGSPRTARRALRASLVALGAAAVTVSLVAATAGGTTSAPAEPVAATSTSFLQEELLVDPTTVREDAGTS